MASVARRMVDPFAEHASLMKELYHEYQRREREDLEAMCSVGALLQEAQDTAAKRQGSVKAIIAEMCRSVAELEVLSTYPEPEGLHERRMTSLKGQKQTAESSSTELQAELRQLEAQASSLAARMQGAVERKAGAEKAAAAEETLLRHQLSLFAHISKVTWRLDKLEHEERIAGTVSDPKTRDLRPFDVDPRHMDAFTVVNSLWSLI